MNKNRTELRDFYLLWSTQSLSQLGSAVTGFALTLWLYEKTGSALSTAMLTICTYAWKNGNLELIQEEKDKIFDEDE